MHNLFQKLRTIGLLSLSLLISVSLTQNAFADSEDDTRVPPSSNTSLDGKDTGAPSSGPASTLNSGRKHRPLVAFALGGGGMRGAAHVGVLKVLEENGIKPDIIVGTSIGSVVGGLYSAGVSIDTMSRKFDDGSLMKAFMTVPLYVRVAAAPILVIPRLIGYHPYDGLYKGNKFRKYLDRSLLEYEQNIESLKIPYGAVAINLIDGKAYTLRKGNLGFAMQASSAVPGLRKPVQIGDKLFVDGGVMDNVPVSQARAMGADFVIAVDVDERFEEVPLATFRKMGSVSSRMIKLQLATIDAPQLKEADIVVHPNVDGISLISTKKSDARRGIAAGEAAARKALPAIMAKLSQAGVALAVQGSIK